MTKTKKTGKKRTMNECFHAGCVTLKLLLLRVSHMQKNNNNNFKNNKF